MWAKQHESRKQPCTKRDRKKPHESPVSKTFGTDSKEKKRFEAEFLSLAYEFENDREIPHSKSTAGLWARTLET